MKIDKYETFVAQEDAEKNWNDLVAMAGKQSLGNLQKALKHTQNLEKTRGASMTDKEKANLAKVKALYVKLINSKR